MTLSAGDTASPGDDLTVSPAVSIESLFGSVLLEAGDNFNLPANTSYKADGTVTVTSTDTNVDAASSTFNVAGDFDATQAIFNGSTVDDAANGDVFNIKPDQDAGDVLTPFQVNGNAPTVVPGDSMNLDLTGLTDPGLSVGPAFGSGQYTFSDAAPVSYTSIETVATIPAVVPLAITYNGTAGDDNLWLRVDNNGGDPRLELLAGVTIGVSGAGAITVSGGSIVDSRLLSGVTSYTINSLAGADKLVIDYGYSLDTASVLEGFDVTFNGGDPATSPSDALFVKEGTFGKVVYNYTNAHDGNIQNYTNPGDVTAGTVTLSLADCDGNMTGNIVSASDVIKQGSGALRLNGANNSYAGTTNINAGALIVNGALTADTDVVHVNNGGTLGGNGTIGATPGGRDVIVHSGGILDPGDLSTADCTPEPGKLTVNGDVTFETGATFRVQLNGLNPGPGAGTYDQLEVNGLVDLGGDAFGSPTAGATLQCSTGFTAPVGAQLHILLNDPSDRIDTRLQDERSRSRSARDA